MASGPDSLHWHVVAAVQRMIEEGSLTAGDRLPVEADLAESLGVTRGVLREGVRVLSGMGILEAKHGSGTYVSDLGPDQALSALGFWVGLQADVTAVEIQAIRQALELEAVTQAALRIEDAGLVQCRNIVRSLRAGLDEGDVDHEAIDRGERELRAILAASSGNRTLASLVNTLATPTLTDLRRTTALSMPEAAHRVDAMGLLVDAVAAHDSYGARLALFRLLPVRADEV